jgi:ATP/maltotriose-dependent transcriptional regulator MalT
MRESVTACPYYHFKLHFEAATSTENPDFNDARDRKGHRSCALRRERVAWSLKSDVHENMVAAVESISKGRRFFTSRVAETVVDAYLPKRSASETDAAKSRGVSTTREREVIQLLAEGKSNKEVAAAWYLHPHRRRTPQRNHAHAQARVLWRN